MANALVFVMARRASFRVLEQGRLIHNGTATVLKSSSRWSVPYTVRNLSGATLSAEQVRLILEKGKHGPYLGILMKGRGSPYYKITVKPKFPGVEKFLR